MLEFQWRFSRNMRWLALLALLAAAALLQACAVPFTDSDGDGDPDTTDFAPQNPYQGASVAEFCDFLDNNNLGGMDEQCHEDYANGKWQLVFYDPLSTVPNTNENPCWVLHPDVGFYGGLAVDPDGVLTVQTTTAFALDLTNTKKDCPWWWSEPGAPAGHEIAVGLKIRAPKTQKAAYAWLALSFGPNLLRHKLRLDSTSYAFAATFGDVLTHEGGKNAFSLGAHDQGQERGQAFPRRAAENHFESVFVVFREDVVEVFLDGRRLWRFEQKSWRQAIKLIQIGMENAGVENTEAAFADLEVYIRPDKPVVSPPSGALPQPINVIRNASFERTYDDLPMAWLHQSLFTSVIPNYETIKDFHDKWRIDSTIASNKSTSLALDTTDVKGTNAVPHSPFAHYCPDDGPCPLLAAADFRTSVDPPQDCTVAPQMCFQVYLKVRNHCSTIVHLRKQDGWKRGTLTCQLPTGEYELIIEPNTACQEGLLCQQGQLWIDKVMASSNRTVEPTYEVHLLDEQAPPRKSTKQPALQGVKVINKTATMPVIDGLPNDPQWGSATVLKRVSGMDVFVLTTHSPQLPPGIALITRSLAVPASSGRIEVSLFPYWPSLDAYRFVATKDGVVVTSLAGEKLGSAELSALGIEAAVGSNPLSLELFIAKSAFWAWTAPSPVIGLQVLDFDFAQKKLDKLAPSELRTAVYPASPGSVQRMFLPQLISAGKPSSLKSAPARGLQGKSWPVRNSDGTAHIPVLLPFAPGELVGSALFEELKHAGFKEVVGYMYPGPNSEVTKCFDNNFTKDSCALIQSLAKASALGLTVLGNGPFQCGQDLGTAYPYPGYRIGWYNGLAEKLKTDFKDIAPALLGFWTMDEPGGLDQATSATPPPCNRDNNPGDPFYAAKAEYRETAKTILEKYPQAVSLVTFNEEQVSRSALHSAEKLGLADLFFDYDEGTGALDTHTPLYNAVSFHRWIRSYEELTSLEPFMTIPQLFKVEGINAAWGHHWLQATTGVPAGSVRAYTGEEIRAQMYLSVAGGVRFFTIAGLQTTGPGWKVLQQLLPELDIVAKALDSKTAGSGPLPWRVAPHRVAGLGVRQPDGDYYLFVNPEPTPLAVTVDLGSPSSVQNVIDTADVLVPDNNGALRFILPAYDRKLLKVVQ